MYAAIVLYTIGMVYSLHRLGLWDNSQLKNTVFWFFTVGFISLFDVTNEKKDNYFKITLKDIFSFTAILQFIISVYTFSFFVELFLVPIGVLIVGMIAVGQRDPENRPVIQFLNNLLALLGLFLIGYTIYRIIKDFHSFANTGTLSDFLIPAALSLLYLPLLYLISLYVNQDDTFKGLNRTFKNRKLLRFAKWQTLLNFGFSKKDLRRWRSIVNLREYRTRAGIQNSIALIKELKKIEKNPPVVPFEAGWSPYKAKDFLARNGIMTRYYHPYFDDNGWSASSSYVNIDESTYLDNVAYYVEGDKKIAKELKLVLNVNSANDSGLSIATFFNHASSLYEAAMNKPLPAEMESAIINVENAEIRDSNRKVVVSINKWPEHKRKGYNIDFVIIIQ